MKKGLLIIVSGPAGSGKGTVLSKLMAGCDEYVYSVSATTRKPRETDIEGVTYSFITREQFEEKIARGEMLEYAEYVGNYYGTPKAPVEAALEAGKNVVLEIETKGAEQVMKNAPDALSIMILPPNGKTLRERLVGRGTETPDVIERRMETARGEVKKLPLYDYVVINNDGAADEAAELIRSIIAAEKAKTQRNNDIADNYFN